MVKTELVPFSKHLVLQKHLYISVLSKNAHLCDNISNSFQSKTQYIVLIFKWSHLDINLWICNLCICQQTSQQNTNFWKRFWHTENTAECSSSITLELAKETISVLRNFCNHPEKGGQNEPKTICFSMYLHFGRIYSEMGKENKLAFRNYIIYLHLFTTKKKNPKKMKWDENETLHLIMMIVKKTVQKTIYIKKFIITTIPPSPTFSLSLSVSENRNKIIQKMYCPWIHYMVQNWLSLNKIALQ